MSFLSKALGVAVKAVVYVGALVTGAVGAVAVSPYKPRINLFDAGNQNPVGVEFTWTQGAIPSNAIPSNAIPSNAIPSNAIPSNAIPSNALPSNAIPSNAIPSNAIPSNALPPSFPGGYFMRPPDFGEEVCGAAGCGSESKYTYYSEEAQPASEPETPLTVDAWSSAYTLTKGECATIGWEVKGSIKTWFNGKEVNPVGEMEVCPTASATYNVDAAGPRDNRAGTIVIINVEEAAEPDTGSEVVELPDRCQLFSGKNISVVYMDWVSGAPLEFYFKIQGGIPGLEKTIPGDNEPWHYSASIGDKSTDQCEYKGYAERLYCTISLPSGYVNAVETMSLSVNGCGDEIFQDSSAFLPDVVGASSPPDGGDDGEESPSCGAAPDPMTSAFASWCSCMGGTYVEGYFYTCDGSECYHAPECSLP